MIYVCVRCGGDAEVKLAYKLLGLDKMKMTFSMLIKNILNQLGFLYFNTKLNRMKLN